MLQINESTLVGIADAIRTKEGSTEPIPTTEMAERIANLPSGGNPYEFINLNIIPRHQVIITAIYNGEVI